MRVLFTVVPLSSFYLFANSKWIQIPNGRLHFKKKKKKKPYVSFVGDITFEYVRPFLHVQMFFSLKKKEKRWKFKYK